MALRGYTARVEKICFLDVYIRVFFVYVFVVSAALFCVILPKCKNDNI